jgi:hypothetical protein
MGVGIPFCWRITARADIRYVFVRQRRRQDNDKGRGTGGKTRIAIVLSKGRKAKENMMKRSRKHQSGGVS